MNGHTISTNIVCVNGKCKKTTNIHKNKKCNKVYDRLINKLRKHKPTRLPHFDELMDEKDPLKLDIPLISMPLLTKSHHHKRKTSRSTHKRKHSRSHKRKTSRSTTHKRKHSSSHKRKTSRSTTTHKRKRSSGPKQTKLAKISKQLASLNKTMKQLKRSK